MVFAIKSLIYILQYPTEAALVPIKKEPGTCSDIDSDEDLNVDLEIEDQEVFNHLKLSNKTFFYFLFSSTI